MLFNNYVAGVFPEKKISFLRGGLERRLRGFISIF